MSTLHFKVSGGFAVKFKKGSIAVYAMQLSGIGHAAPAHLKNGWLTNSGQLIQANTRQSQHCRSSLLTFHKDQKYQF